ncbi:hypothetical protein [Methylobacterium sp. Leaf118]|uniref:hypothetical protein n=1 Tax=Methylobacterium sp. Leaf118 TaxID=2876562 RepID=UPI001E5785D0|nr:hypothetical protein [Methylobacterium sp. Leaf118]
MTGQADPHRAQILRQQCNRTFAGKRHADVVGAIEMLTADLLLALPGLTEKQAIGGADAIAADIRNIIRERFAAAGKGH